MITIRNPYIKFDKFGHCVACHEDLRFKEVIDGEEKWRLSPRYDTLEFLLDNGAKMKVAMCKKCQSHIEESDYKTIMDAVKKGWEVEAEYLVKSKDHPHWGKKQKDKYLKEFNKREIVVKSEGVSDDILKKELKKYKEKD